MPPSSKRRCINHPDNFCYILYVVSTLRLLIVQSFPAELNEPTPIILDAK